MTTPLKRAGDKTITVSSSDPTIESKTLPGTELYAEELLSSYYDGVIGINKQGCISFANKTACRIIGCSREEIKDIPLEEIFPFYNEIVEHPYIKIINNIIESGNVYGPIKHHKITNKKKNDLLVNFSISPHDENTVILIFNKLSKNNQQHRPLLYQYSHDPLTRLVNRNTLQESINCLHEDYKKNGNSYSILLLDIDRFKLINDNYGHHIGDQLLQLVAERMQFFIRDKDNLGRWGGQEFLCMLPDSGINSAYQIAKRICRGISEKNFFLDEKEIPASISIGIANFPNDGNTPEELFRVADTTLHQAKQNGRNRVHSSEQSTGNIFSAGTLLENALNENRITPVYQPIFNIATGEQVAEEALARIRDKNGELIAANEFIDAAVELQLVHRIDQQIIKKMIMRCTDNFKATNSALPHFVNVSADLLRHPQLVKDILNFARKKYDECGQYSCHEKPLVIEITEQELLGNMDEVKRILKPFIEFGMPLAIDDFGSGYSSLSYLADLPIKYLKFDGALIKRVAYEDRARKIISGIQQMAESLELTTIAEHIENQETLDTLRDIGVAWGQGYFSAKPSK